MKTLFLLTIAVKRVFHNKVFASVHWNKQKLLSRNSLSPQALWKLMVFHCLISLIKEKTYEALCYFNGIECICQSVMRNKWHDRAC